MYRSPEATPVDDWDIIPSIDIRVGATLKKLYEDEDSYPVIDVERAPLKNLLTPIVEGVEEAGYDSAEMFDKKLGFEVRLSEKGDLEQQIILSFKSSERDIGEVVPPRPGKNAIFLTLLPKRWEVVPSINVKAGQKFAKEHPGKVLEIDQEAAASALEILSSDDAIIPKTTYIELGGKLPANNTGEATNLSAQEQLIKLKVTDDVVSLNRTVWHELQHIADFCSPKESYLNDMAPYPDTRKGRRYIMRSFVEFLGGSTLVIAGVNSAPIFIGGLGLTFLALYEGSKAIEIGDSYQNHRAEVRARKAAEKASEFPPIITIS